MLAIFKKIIKLFKPKYKRKFKIKVFYKCSLNVPM